MHSFLPSSRKMAMRACCFALWLGFIVSVAEAQVQGKFPPDSLINVKVFARATPVQQVTGQMRSFAGSLGVRCRYCHVGEEGRPLAEYDFASDDRRPKLVARQMMRMVEEINHRLDTLPERPDTTLRVTCSTCHRGIARPVPLAVVIGDTTVAAGADAGIRAYRALRERYYGRDAYDFGENSLSSAALRVARAGRPADGLALLDYNEALFPWSSSMAVVRGNIQLMQTDTAAAVAAFRQALERDSTNGEARNRLRELDRQP